MSTIDSNKRMQKWRTEQEIRMALNDFISQKYALHIPPQVEDADMVLSDVIEELLQARKVLDVFNTTPFAKLTKEQKQAIQEWQDFVSLVSPKQEAEEL